MDLKESLVFSFMPQEVVLFQLIHEVRVFHPLGLKKVEHWASKSPFLTKSDSNNANKVSIAFTDLFGYYRHFHLKVNSGQGDLFYPTRLRKCMGISRQP